VSDPASWETVFDERSRAVLRLADAVSTDSHVIDDDLVRGLRELFDEVQLAELVLVAGQANLNNRAGNAAKQLLGGPRDRGVDQPTAE
jgi:alkylhydroperoxidase family enzyme